jgi:hypothetical protein
MADHAGEKFDPPVLLGEDAVDSHAGEEMEPCETQLELE